MSKNNSKNKNDKYKKIIEWKKRIDSIYFPIYNLIDIKKTILKEKNNTNINNILTSSLYYNINNIE